jgi:hypothetical protein
LAKSVTLIIPALLVAVLALTALGDQFAPIVRSLPPTDPNLLGESATSAAAATPGTKPVPAVSATEPALVVESAKSRIVLHGRFNGPASLLEAGACAKNGRTATALVTVAATPSAISEAMKSLGVAAGEVPVASVVDGSVVGPRGRQAVLWVEWSIEINGKPSALKARLEDFFWSRSREAHPAEGPWVYAGSKNVQGVLVADLSGTVATTKWDDTSALFYFKAKPGSETYRPNPTLSPAEGTPCDLVVEVLPAEVEAGNVSSGAAATMAVKKVGAVEAQSAASGQRAPAELPERGE